MMPWPVRDLTTWVLRPASPHALAAVRIAVNGYSLWYLTRRWKLITKTAAGHRRNFRPVGVARVLRRPLPVGVVEATTAATYVTTGLAIAGIGHRVNGPLNAALTWWTLTYRNSWSMVFHSDNVMTLHSVVLGMSRAADAWSIDSCLHRRRNHPDPMSSWVYGWPLQTMNAITAATYFISGVAKLRGPLGWRWASGEHLRSQVAVDGIRKAVLEPRQRAESNVVIDTLERHRWLWTVMATSSLVLELAAPLAVVDRRLGRIWSIGAWSMHIGIKIVMRITFRYQLAGVPYLPLAIQPIANGVHPAVARPIATPV